MMKILFAVLVLLGPAAAMAADPVEKWDVFDNYSLLSQLDLLPKAAP